MTLHCLLLALNVSMNISCYHLWFDYPYQFFFYYYYNNLKNVYCIYQPIYTIFFGWCTAISARPRRSYDVVLDLIALLRRPHGDPIALLQDGGPTAFVLSMFKVRAVARRSMRSLAMPRRCWRFHGAQVGVLV